MDDSSYVGTHYRSEEYNKPPYNRYTIIRAQFDKWFSSKVREAGALLICGNHCQQPDLGRQPSGGRELRPRTRRRVCRRGDLGRRRELHPGAQGRFPRRDQGQQRGFGGQGNLVHCEDTIRQRFNVGEENGVVIETMGTITDGMMGTGFLYTNKESLTIGIGCMLGDFKANPNKTSPYTLLEKFKQHPSIAPLVAGGEMKSTART